MIHPLVRYHQVIRAAHAWVRGSLCGAAGALSVWVGVRHIVARRPHILLRPFAGGRLHGAAQHLRRDSVGLHLAWALHSLSVVGVWILPLDGPPVGARVRASILAVHLLLLAAVLHAVHVSLVALGWRPVHAVHVAFVILKCIKTSHAGVLYSYNHAHSDHANSCYLVVTFTSR